MLNLVQLQEDLKMYPQQAINAYANGANPDQVPPYMALAENLRRKKMRESAAAEQAKEMEGAPTIKEQIEQEVASPRQTQEQLTGLLALQGARQRQASQQQAGAQANMPMAAPNTTTSEPAQLAGGGFVDDIVVPRDYAPGGSVINPDVLKQIMYREAMQGDVADIPKELISAVRKQALRRAPGIPGLPMSRDMFSRSDYAGGGIVAFEVGGSVKRVSGKTLTEYLDSVAETLDSMTNLTEDEKRQRIELARQQFMSSNADPSDQADYPDESRRGMRTAPPSMRGTQAALPPDTDAFARPQRAPSSSIGLAALTRALGIDPSAYFTSREPRSVEQMLTEQKRLQGLAGISEELFDKRAQDLRNIQSRREEERGKQPMEQFREFLLGVSEARGGTPGTQGAAGAKRAIALEKEQRILRDKQDMDMADLVYTNDAKRDAIRRGDLKDAQARSLDEEKLKREVDKDRVDLIVNQARIENQARQTEAYGEQTKRQTGDERTEELYRRYAKEKGIAPTIEGYLEFKRQLELSGKVTATYTRRDAIKDAIKELPGATTGEIQKRADELMRIYSSGTSGAAPGGQSTSGWGELKVR